MSTDKYVYPVKLREEQLTALEQLFQSETGTQRTASPFEQQKLETLENHVLQVANVETSPIETCRNAGETAIKQLKQFQQNHTQDTEPFIIPVTADTRLKLDFYIEWCKNRAEQRCDPFFMNPEQRKTIETFQQNMNDLVKNEQLVKKTELIDF